LGLAVVCLIAKNSPGPAVAFSGAAKNPVGEGLAIALLATWLLGVMPAIALNSLATATH
jgi:hypothetical protein